MIRTDQGMDITLDDFLRVVGAQYMENVKLREQDRKQKEEIARLQAEIAAKT